MGTPNHNDDWDDLKTKGATSTKVAKLATPVTASSGQLFKDWVGYNDEYDYKAFTLNSAAALALYITASGTAPTATKFTICQLVESTDKNGSKTYSLKKLQSVSAKYDKGTQKYSVITDSLLLLKGTYYICIQATDAKKTNSSTDYTISLQNKSAGAFYTKAVNTDDWDDLKTKGASGKVGAAVTVTASTGNIIANNWVGFSDEFDYKAITLNSAAQISFSITSGTMPDYGQVIKVGIYALRSSTDNKGATTYSLNQLLTVSPKYDKGTNKYVIDTAALLLDKGTYYIGVQSLDAKKGGGTDYTVALNKTASEFFSSVVTVSASTGNIIANDWVGYGDEYDYQAITINSAAKLSLSITSTDAVKISICALDGKDGKYSFKSLQSTAAKYDKNTKKYVVDTAALLLDKGTYYLCVQSTNAKKAGTKATYTVALNKTSSVFFTKGVNTDDWDDLKTKGAAGKVGAAVTVTAGTGNIIANNWVGYGDEYDYKAITLNSAAKLSFSVTATDAAKFAVYSLKATTKNDVTTYSLNQLQSVSLKYDKTTKKYTVDTAGLLLDKGTYYIGMQSTNAKKGGSADYTVALNKSGSEFFTRGSSNDNDWNSCPAFTGTLSNGELGGSFEGWLGYGDPVDYRAFTTSAANGGGGYYYFDLAIPENSQTNLNLTVYEVVENKGVKSLKKLKSATATSKRYGVVGIPEGLMLKANTKYVVGIEDPGAKQAKNSTYTLEVYQDRFAHFNMNNNEAKKATKLNYDSTAYGTVTKAAGGDNVDWYDVSAFKDDLLELGCMSEKMSLKLTFYDDGMNKVEAGVMNMENLKTSIGSSLTINTKYGLYCAPGYVNKNVKYLAVEAGNSSRNSYVITSYY